jgi:hypothetical protein
MHIVAKKKFLSLLGTGPQFYTHSACSLAAILKEGKDKFFSLEWAFISQFLA